MHKEIILSEKGTRSLYNQPETRQETIGNEGRATTSIQPSALVIIPIIRHIASQPPEHQVEHNGNATNDEKNALEWMEGDVVLDATQFMIEVLIDSLGSGRIV